MQNLRALVIDDDPKDILRLEQFITAFNANGNNRIEVANICTTIDEAVEILHHHEFDISFLDFQLSDEENLYDLCERVNVERFGVKVLHTARPAPIDGLERGGLVGDYIFLRKPPLTELREPKFSDDLENKLKRYQALRERRQGQRYVISNTEGQHFIPCSEIIYIEGNGSYSTFFLTPSSLRQSQIMCSKNLAKIEREIDYDLMLRCSKSYIVNYGHIHRIVGSDIEVKLDDNTLATVPRATRIFKKSLEKAGLLP